MLLLVSQPQRMLLWVCSLRRAAHRCSGVRRGDGLLRLRSPGQSPNPGERLRREDGPGLGLHMHLHAPTQSIGSG